VDLVVIQGPSDTVNLREGRTSWRSYSRVTVG
jgi:hypothetical protein